MIDVRYDISRLFKAAFGTSLGVYFPVGAYVSFPSSRTPYKPDLDGAKTDLSKEKISSMGTPVLSPVSFKGGSYKRYNQKGVIETINMADFSLPDVTLVDMYRAKKIIKTDVLGNNGTVKELYGFDDWSITLRLLYIDTNMLSAQEQALALLKWENLADAISISAPVLNQRDVFSLVIERIDLKTIQGQSDVVPVEIKAVSDEPLELIL